MRSSPSRPVLFSFCLVLALSAATVLAGAGCDDDPYSGTWKSTTLFQSQSETEGHPDVIRIEKVGEGWTVTDSKDRSFLCRELADGGLVAVRGPSGNTIKNGWVLQLDGDELRDDMTGLVYRRE